MHFISYPEDFKQKVKKVYPSDKVLHQMLENGNSDVGYLLDVNSPTSSSLDALVRAIKSHNIDNFIADQKAPVEKVALYVEWGKLYIAQVL